MALVETFTRLGAPSMIAVSVCRFGLNVRRVMPVGLRPKPPLLTACPRHARRCPKLVFFPVKWQTLGIGHLKDPEKRGRKHSLPGACGKRPIFGRPAGNSSAQRVGPV